MARNNYSYEKRQRELAKKRKKEEKLKRKVAGRLGPEDAPQPPAGEAPASAAPASDVPPVA